VQRFNSARSLTRAERGELMLDVQHRAVTALFDLRTQYPFGTVAIVTHGDVIRSILLFALGMPIDFDHRIEIWPARVTLLDSKMRSSCPRGQQFPRNAPQEVRVAVIPVRDERMAEDHDTHASPPGAMRCR
jgi:broad specificity phosphatase PhoE